MRASVDGDIILYSVAFAAKNDSLAYACRSVRSAIESIMTTLNVEGADVYLTGKGNYRIEYGDVQYPYKGNRDKEKPDHFEGLSEYMTGTLGAIMVEGEEADDRMGIDGYAQTHIICTLDKDLDMIPGWHYNFRKKELYMVNPEDGERFFYKQLLTGDSTDNIPGLFKRLGKKVTKKVWEPLDEMYEPAEMYAYVRGIYKQQALDIVAPVNDDDIDRWLLHQGRQLWIRRHEGEMWDAPTS